MNPARCPARNSAAGQFMAGHEASDGYPFVARGKSLVTMILVKPLLSSYRRCHDVNLRNTQSQRFANLLARFGRKLWR